MLIPWSFVALCGPTNSARMCGKKMHQPFDKKDWQWRYGSCVEDGRNWQFSLLGEAHIERWKTTVLQCNMLLRSVRRHWQSEDMSVQILSPEACKYDITLSCLVWHLLMTYFCGHVSFVIYRLHCNALLYYCGIRIEWTIQRWSVVQSVHEALICSILKSCISPRLYVIST